MENYTLAVSCCDGIGDRHRRKESFRIGVVRVPVNLARRCPTWGPPDEPLNRAGLTGFVAGISRQSVRNNVTMNGLLPGCFDTYRIRSNLEETVKKSGRSVEDLLAERAKNNPAGRLGNIQEFGAMCAFLCSHHAGYITGQNILMDGGAFRSSV